MDIGKAIADLADMPTHVNVELGRSGPGAWYVKVQDAEPIDPQAEWYVYTGPTPEYALAEAAAETGREDLIEQWNLSADEEGNWQPAQPARWRRCWVPTRPP
jgi:hypothetical protein